METRGFIDECCRKCLMGEPLNREELIRLLSISVGSEEDLYLRAAAREVAAKITSNKSYIWCAVGMDFAPCSMNCKFCSFGEAWNVIEASRHVTRQEILESVRRYASGGAAYIVLRTTEFYDVDTLLSYIPEIRKQVPGDYVMILNTGELDAANAQKAADNGIYGAYHAVRIREGMDTPFDPNLRRDTMKNISSSPLKLISLIEPVGPEHTAEEIADTILNAVACGASISGIMARFPVKGTPLGDTRRLTDDEIAHLIAVTRIAGGNVIKDICVHPASDLAFSAGANIMVVESGAIPRDSAYAEEDWADTDMKRARELMENNGFTVSTVM